MQTVRNVNSAYAKYLLNDISVSRGALKTFLRFSVSLLLVA